jgi:hypothetical protein
VDDGLRQRLRNGRGSVDCLIRIGSRRNGSAKPPSSPGGSSTRCPNRLTTDGFADSNTMLRSCSTAGFAASPRSRAAADTASACSSESRRPVRICGVPRGPDLRAVCS